MADLDDFFAKRDKSKKSKKKFDTTEDVAKILEQKAKDKKKLETGKSNYSDTGRQSPGPGLPAAGEDDEWLEAEDKAPDFSNLKIQELILTSDEEEDPSQSAVEGEAEVGVDGPWKKKTSKGKKGEVEDKEEEAATEAPKPEGEEDKPAKPEGDEAEAEEGSKEEKKEEKKYVPPSMRNKTEGGANPSSSSSSSYVPPSRRIPMGSAAAGPLLAAKKKGAAPAIADEEAFPSLN